MSDLYDAFETFATWGLVVFAFGLVFYLAYLQYRKYRHHRHRRRKRAHEARIRAEMEMTPPPQPLRQPGPQVGTAKATDARQTSPPSQTQASGAAGVYPSSGAVPRAGSDQ